MGFQRLTISTLEAGVTFLLLIPKTKANQKRTRVSNIRAVCLNLFGWWLGLCHTQQCSDLTPCSALKDHSSLGSLDYMGCEELNMGCHYARQEPYPL